MAWSKWIDLAMSETSRDMPFDMPAPVSSGPRYPYGLRISLDDATLSSLDIDLKDIINGAEIDLRAFGHVVAFSNEDGRCSVSIQLTRLKVENEDEEDEADEETE